jgi:SAM-dependent methyltransferase
MYLESVQEPRAEVAFFDRVFRREFGRRPRVLREDFCGTAAICYAWVRGRPQCRTLGVDHDPEALDWGRRHLAPRLTAAERSRVRLLCQDVRRVHGPRADVIGAQNFSFWVFKTPRDLLRYFRAARRNLGRRGVFVLDMMGGSETLEEGLTYIWEQARFDPITHDCTFYIHFRFPDGRQMKRAFEYHWRLWTIPEVRDLLLQAGFRRVDVYWEGTDRTTGQGNGVYRRRDHAESDPAWIAYFVAVK